MTIIEAKFGKRAPDDLANILRSMADDVDAGRITSAVFAFTKIGHYELNFSASLEDSLVLSTLLHDSAIQKFKL